LSSFFPENRVFFTTSASQNPARDIRWPSLTTPLARPMIARAM